MALWLSLSLGFVSLGFVSPGFVSRAEAQRDAPVLARTEPNPRARWGQLERRLSRLAEADADAHLRPATSFGMGGVAMALAASADRPARGYRYAVGTLSLLRGAVDLVVSPRVGGRAAELGRMSMSSPEDVARRVRAGEGLLRSLADAQRAARVARGTLRITSGLSYVPLYLARNEWGLGTWRDGLALLSAGLTLALGVVDLVEPSDAESALRDYLGERPGGPASPRLRFGPGGFEFRW